MYILCAHSVMSDSAAPWTVAHQAPLSMGFSRQDSWSELPFPSPGDLPDPGIQAGSPIWVSYQLSHWGSPCMLPCLMFILQMTDALVFLFFFLFFFFLLVFFTLINFG